MENNFNNHLIKSTQNYSNLVKKPTPISILTGENTIFIKTNQNQLKDNYIRNGNQIKHNKNYLSTTINQSQSIYNSLKNTFTMRKKSNIININKKNLKDINNRLNEFIKNNKYKGLNHRVTNSFIKNDRSNKNNISSLNTINGFGSNNHIFNFHNMTTKLNNSSLKVKHKIKKELKNFDENKKLNLNEIDKNNFNSTQVIGAKASSLNINKKLKKNSLSKKDKTLFYKKINYLNNLSNLIKSSNHDNIYFRTINSYLDNDIGRENSRIKRKFYYQRKINNKYIYSIEKKKEKSLAEKRQRAKKPISYLIKNNYLDQLTNEANINRNIMNLNNVKKENKRIKEKEIKENKVKNKIIDFKKKIYNIDNYNYNKNVEKDENKKIKRNLELKTIEINNFRKISPINAEKSIKNNKSIINNNYYSINNTFIFDNFGNKLNQYDLTKLIDKNNNYYSSNINYTEGNDYNQNNFKRIDTDVERRKNFIIKNFNKKIKKKIKPDNIDIKIKLNINNKYNNLIETSKNNNNNKIKLNKLSNSEIISLINDKSKNNFPPLSLNNKLCISNAIKKGITTMNKNTKEIIKNKIRAIKEIKHEQNDNNKEKTLNNKNNLNLNVKNYIPKIYNNHKSIYERVVNRKKSGNVTKISKNINLDNDINDNLIKYEKLFQKNEKQEKNKLNENIRQNKIVSHKTFNNKMKNKSYNNNIEKLNEFNIKEEIPEINKNNNYIKNNIEQQSKKLKENNININNLFFEEYEIDDDIYEKNYIIEEDKEQNERKHNSSFEIISLSVNNLDDDNLINQEDNFDDINSIIKKINFNIKENGNDDIFSLNNMKYRNYDKIFDKKFDELFKK